MAKRKSSLNRKSPDTEKFANIAPIPRGYGIHKYFMIRAETSYNRWGNKRLWIPGPALMGIPGAWDDLDMNKGFTTCAFVLDNEKRRPDGTIKSGRWELLGKRENSMAEVLKSTKNRMPHTKRVEEIFGKPVFAQRETSSGRPVVFAYFERQPFRRRFYTKKFARLLAKWKPEIYNNIFISMIRGKFEQENVPSQYYINHFDVDTHFGQKLKEALGVTNSDDPFAI